MISEELDYLRRRERQERGVPRSAATMAGRRAHQQLAECYAMLLHSVRGHDPLPPLRRDGLL